ncbi:c-type cytochrome [Candidatus Entotheonella palauensis]|uniref:c-type cytochrome n=1 Tax=Candidatus Entotheonella palauensis TaxID=93172 RepID=UPI000B7FF8E8|nr:c-type cytochrome [Candidatus Entotheonella palauensis]
MKPAMLFVIVTALTLDLAQAQDTDTGTAEKIYSSVCRNCHGPTGLGMASFPSLSGKDADYIASRLKQYRAGEKIGPNSPLMIPHATKLSDDEIANLASYISKTFSRSK